MKPYVVGAIFARGGSKGVPRKNIRPLNGKPLIAYAIEAALNSRLIDTVIVSTDDPEIAAISKDFGAEVPFMRPAELAQDDAPEWLAWRHAVQTLAQTGHLPKMDVMASVPPTAPLRTARDIDRCIQELCDSDADIVISVRSADRNPYFNMVTINDKGRARLVLAPEQTIERRQDAPAVFDITTVAYAVRPDFVLSADSMFDGTVRAVHVPPERALDIDTELDFKFAEFLLQSE